MVQKSFLAIIECLACLSGQPDVMQRVSRRRKLKYLNSSWSFVEDESQATINMIHWGRATGRTGFRGWLAGLTTCHRRWGFLGTHDGVLEYVVMQGNVRVAIHSCGAIKQIHCLDKNETINFYDDYSVDVWDHFLSHFSLVPGYDTEKNRWLCSIDDDGQCDNSLSVRTCKKNDENCLDSTELCDN